MDDSIFQNSTVSSTSTYDTATKATHGYERIQTWAPVVKSQSGYVAVLSDDSIDREGEIIGKSALLKVSEDQGYLAILIDHENKALNHIGEWVNKRIELIEGHNALVADAKFYKSNPQAEVIKGLLDEGAKLGISIGALPKAHKQTERNGKAFKEYTDMEILEASFVAIPANAHAHAVAMAKGLDLSRKTTEDNMSEELNKDAPEPVAEPSPEVAKPATEEVVEPAVEEAEEKSLPESSHEELSKKLGDTTSELSKALDKVESLTKELSTVREELETAQKELVDVKEQASATPVSKAMAEVMTGKDLDNSNSYEEGQIPVFKRQNK